MNLENTYEILVWGSEVKSISLIDLFKESEKTLLYFYPKDNTPGCTIENKDFTCLKTQFTDKWISLVWVSKDSIESHKKFLEKQELAVDLLSDPELVLHKELWAFWEKNNYWKIVEGVIRSTFLIDSKGEVLQEWKNIKATWHAERILKLV